MEIEGIWICYELLEIILMMYNRNRSNDLLFQVIKSLDTVIKPFVLIDSEDKIKETLEWKIQNTNNKICKQFLKIMVKEVKQILDEN